MPHISQTRPKTTKTRVRSKYQITIPDNIRAVYPVAEGQYLDVRLVPEGILLSAVPDIDPEQAWFWSPRWQEREREADADFRAGRVVRGSSADALLKKLKVTTKKQ